MPTSDALRPTPPPPEEWDFGEPRVPERQLQACYFYEFAREFAKTSPEWLTSVRELGSQVSVKDWKTLYQYIRGLYGSYYLSVHWLRDQSLTSPWQALPLPEREEEVAQCTAFSRPPDSDLMDCVRIFYFDNVSEMLPIAGEFLRAWLHGDKALHPRARQRVHGFAAIDLDFTDEQLKAAFACWLNEQRKLGRKPRRSKRGKVRMRQHLTALGAKRLLDAGLRVAQAKAHTERLLGTPLYPADRSWSRAKTVVVPKVLQQLFPGPAKATE